MAINLKQFSTAVIFADQLMFTDAGDPEKILLASLAHKKNLDLNRAADLGERLRIRDPWNLRNLLNLGDIYARLNIQRAREILEDLEKIAPSDGRVKKIKLLLQATYRQSMPPSGENA